MFHLFTHAMFKALLFLTAGSIIHAVHSNFMQDMGSLRKYMPVTHFTFLAAALAISGIPPFAGFFSKDEILAAALHSNKLLFYTEYITAGITAFYIFRLYFSVFWGKDTKYEHTPHESPLNMTIPLIFLALGATFGGFIPFHDLVSPDMKPDHEEINFMVALPSIGIGLLGIVIAWFLYVRENNMPQRIAKRLGALYTVTFHKFYIDEIYLFVTKKIIFRYIAAPIAWFDRHVVDGFMVAIGVVTMRISVRIKGLQSGELQQYAFVFIAGALILLLFVAYMAGVQ
jgi:NADH-quinone oxidoreductase subunit L